MNIGDLVKLKSMSRRSPMRVGLIVDLIEKKCWRTSEHGPHINWSIIDPEPHAVVAINGGKKLTIPIVDLDTFDEGR